MPRQRRVTKCISEQQWKERVPPLRLQRISCRINVSNNVPPVIGSGGSDVESHTNTTASRAVVTELDQYLGASEEWSIVPNCTPKKVDHICTPQCVVFTPLYEDLHSILREHRVSPLALPRVFGWKRIVKSTHDDEDKIVNYVTPCNKNVFTFESILKVLISSGSILEIDNFSFNPLVNYSNSFVSRPGKIICADFTKGEENIPISVDNIVDKVAEHPVLAKYSKVSGIGEGVFKNSDDGFLVCCDCVNDCMDKINCPCFKLTLDNCESLGRTEEEMKNFGYNYRLLRKQILSGIYECNSKFVNNIYTLTDFIRSNYLQVGQKNPWPQNRLKLCKCTKRCVNRVVQQGIKWRLQLFKTEFKGWGVRTLHDIPPGSFVSTYSGEIITNKTADELSTNLHNGLWKYLTSLKVVDSIKEGYEREVIVPDLPLPNSPRYSVCETKSSLLPESPESGYFCSDTTSPSSKLSSVLESTDKYCESTKNLNEVISSSIASKYRSSKRSYIFSDSKDNCEISKNLYELIRDRYQNTIKVRTFRTSKFNCSLPGVVEKSTVKVQIIDTCNPALPLSKCSKNESKMNSDISACRKAKDLETTDLKPTKYYDSDADSGHDYRSDNPEIDFKSAVSAMSTLNLDRWKKHKKKDIDIKLKLPKYTKFHSSEKWLKRRNLDEKIKKVEKIKSKCNKHRVESSKRSSFLRRLLICTPTTTRKLKIGNGNDILKRPRLANSSSDKITLTQQESTSETTYNLRPRRISIPLVKRIYCRKYKRSEPPAAGSYTVDGGMLGNIGRYYNHSCDPNLFPQCVFIDSHDLNFPTLAFFTAKFIAAGTELTWDYKYEKIDNGNAYFIPCHCRSTNCCGRLV